MDWAAHQAIELIATSAAPEVSFVLVEYRMLPSQYWLRGG
jgi:hypothetical protein